MLKFTALILAAAMSLSLIGCAGNAKQGIPVKCPACGYEFEAHPHK